ncbi:MAG TPA: KGG domain-containing protein [Patescibacteria group bacterium]|nr:KGG domain-containing protein [Patescibacteria group bacterium]
MADTTNRGFASMDEDQQHDIAQKGGDTRRDQGTDYSKLGQKGGKAAQESGHAHQLTEEERREGGEHSHKND